MGGRAEGGRIRELLYLQGVEDEGEPDRGEGG